MTFVMNLGSAGSRGNSARLIIDQTFHEFAMEFIFHSTVVGVALLGRVKRLLTA